MIMLILMMIGCGDASAFRGLASGADAPETDSAEDTAEDPAWPSEVAVAETDALVRDSGALGTSALGGADLDGDGVDDLVLGDPSATGGAGRLVVVPGARVVPTGRVGEIDGEGAEIAGAAAEGLGSSLALAGAIGDDDFLDVIAGLPGADAALLLFGPFDGADFAASRRIVSDTEGLGAAVAGGASLDDGEGGSVADLALAAPEAESGAGAVWLVEGASLRASTADEVELRTLDPQVLIGAPGDGLGAALALADITGDGLGELVLGAPGNDRAWLVSGDDLLRATLGEANIADVALASLISDDPEGAADCDDPLGSAIAVGQADGAFVALGAPCLSDRGHVVGGALIYDVDSYWTRGALAPSLRLLGDDPERALGGSVAITDLDGDARPDLAVGSVSSRDSSAPTGAWVVTDIASRAGTDYARLSQDDGDVALTGDADGRWNMSAAGDVDDDGLSDLLLARPGRDQGGAVWLLLGAED